MSEDPIPGHLLVVPARNRTYIPVMRISRRSAQVILTLCLILLQAQVWASSALGCRHAGAAAGNGDMDIACPLHQGSSGQEDGGQPQRLLDCQKCILHCAIGIHAPGALPAGLPDVGLHGESDARPERHFYRFSPDRFLRPPIS